MSDECIICPNCEDKRIRNSARKERADGGMVDDEGANPGLRQPAPSFTAYHGSPHDFDQFDISKIGTGEGAQAYGHGLYFADNEKVANSYKLAGKPAWYNPQMAKIATDAHAQAVASGASDPIAEARNILWAKREASTDPFEKRRIDDAYNNISDLAKSGSGGKIYHVAIAADPEHFLDWDKPLSAIPKQHLDAINSLPGVKRYLSETDSGKWMPNATVEKAMQKARYSGYTDSAVAKHLYENGIPGIKYLDQGSRGREGSGSHNYVVFHHEPVKILKKYKKGGQVARAEGGGLPELPKLPSVRQSREVQGHHNFEPKRAHMLHVGPIHSAVAGRTDHLPTHVPSGSFVLPADVVSGMGEGNTVAGFKVLKRVFSGVPYSGAGNPYGQGALPYGRAKGGEVRDDGVACVLAGGEFVVAPHHVAWVGEGDKDAGHKALDDFVLQQRAKHVKTLKKLPRPARD